MDFRRVWGEEKGTSGMPEIPAPPYQKLYSGYRYAGDATPKTASMDLHGRPIEPIMTTSIKDGEVEPVMYNTGLRVSQKVPPVPAQATYSMQGKGGDIKKALSRRKIPMNERIESQIESQRFACSFGYGSSMP